MSKQIVTIRTGTSSISQRMFVATKQWIYAISEKVSRSHAEARTLAFLITHWLEYIALHYYPFSITFCPQYIQLYSLLLLDNALDINEELRKRCPTQNLLNLAYNVFSHQEVYRLQGELQSINLPVSVKIEPLLKGLEKLLTMIPQTSQIRNVALILLDAYNLQFFGILADKPKIAAASIAISRYWVLEKEEERWLPEYEKKTNMNLESFKESYNQIYCIAYLINQKNLSKKRAREIGKQPKIQESPQLVELNFISPDKLGCLRVEGLPSMTNSNYTSEDDTETK